MSTNKKIRVSVGGILIVLAFILLIGLVGGIESNTITLAGAVISVGGSGVLGFIVLLLMHDLTEEDLKEAYCED